MRLNTVLLLGLVCLLATASIVADGQLRFAGNVGMLCQYSTATADLNTPEPIVDSKKHWASGFLDGAHAVLGLPPVGSSVNFRYARLQNECGRNQQSTMGEAMLTLVDEDRLKEQGKAVQPSDSQAMPEARASLTQMLRVRVVVENISTEVQRDGLTSSVIEATVKQRLLKAGIPLLSSASSKDQLGYWRGAQPYLYVNVNTQKRGDLYALALSVEVHQLLNSIVTKELTWGTTWEHSQIGFVAAADIRTVLPTIGQLTDDFASDWLAVNPGSR